MNLQCSRVLLIFAVAIFASGCSSDRLDTYPVTGKVVFEEGDSPRFGDIELFHPGKQINARGKLAKDGTFTLGTYDLDDVAFAESLDEAVELAARITVPFGPPTKQSDVEAKFNKQTRLQSQARRRFLSRISKQASFVDHDRLMFLKADASAYLGDVLVWCRYEYLRLCDEVQLTRFYIPHNHRCVLIDIDPSLDTLQYLFNPVTATTSHPPSAPHPTVGTDQNQSPLQGGVPANSLPLRAGTD